MSLARPLRALAMLALIAALVVGVMPVAASPASITATSTYYQGSGLSITLNWNSGTDNNSPQVWVCTSYNGGDPLSFDFGARAARRRTSSGTAPIPSASIRIAAAQCLSTIRPRP